MATPTERQAQAILEAGGIQTNSIFEIAFVLGTFGGTFPVSLNGQTSAPIPYPVSSADLSTALNLVSTIGTDGTVVKGPIGGPFTVEMVGGNAGEDVGLLEVDGSNLAPSQTVQVAELQVGDSTDYTAAAAQAWSDNSSAPNENLQFLYTKLAIANLRWGMLSNTMAQTKTGQINVVDVTDKRFDQLGAIIAKTQNDIADALLATSNQTRQSAGTLMRKTTPNGLAYGLMQRNPQNGRYS